jgi:mRNA (guanine-N7-)-methyltransferase
LRIFHNWIKSKLLSDAVDYLKSNYDIKHNKLLDLATARGGDMHKWISNDINNVVGFDTDKNSIYGENGAIDRYKRLVNRLKNKGKEIPIYEFHVVDLSVRENIKKLDQIIKKRKFDIVSCQFAIHYFFKSQETLETFIKIVKRYVSKNGIFIGTTMDGNRIDQMFVLQGRDIIKKNLYYLENKTIKSDTPYGNTILVSLGEKEGETHYFRDEASKEFKVDVEELKRVCDNNGLRFIGTTSFERWYELYKGDKNTNNKYLLGPEEKEFSFLNFSFIFINKN